jgi:hypothetical protein
MSLLQLCVLNPLSKLIDVVTGAAVTVLTEGEVTRTSDDVYVVPTTDGTILADGTLVSGAQDIQLPVANVPLKKVFTIKCVTATCPIVIECVDLTTPIDFATYTSLVNQGDSVQVQWDGSQYWILSGYAA